MTNLRTRLADALANHQGICDGHTTTECWCGEEDSVRGNGIEWADHATDVLLSLPGIAIVELPEGADVGQGWTQFKNIVVGPDGDIRDESSSYPVQHNAATARRHAAALLAAANAAEEAVDG